MKQSDMFWVSTLLFSLLIGVMPGNHFFYGTAGLIVAPNFADTIKYPDKRVLQVAGTDINIEAPHLNIDNAILDVNLEVYPVPAAGKKETEKLNYKIKLTQAKGQLHLPDITEGRVSIHFTLIAFAPGKARSWQSDFVLNGSGRVNYRLVAGGRGLAMVWPAVTASAKNGPLDVYINNIGIGSTNITRGVNPQKELQIEWKKNDKVICNTKLKLAYNIKRKCICNETDGKVTLE